MGLLCAFIGAVERLAKLTGAPDESPLRSLTRSLLRRSAATLCKRLVAEPTSFFHPMLSLPVLYALADWPELDWPEVELRRREEPLVKESPEDELRRPLPSGSRRDSTECRGTPWPWLDDPSRPVAMLCHNSRRFASI